MRHDDYDYLSPEQARPLLRQYRMNLRRRLLIACGICWGLTLAVVLLFVLL